MLMERKAEVEASTLPQIEKVKQIATIMSRLSELQAGLSEVSNAIKYMTEVKTLGGAH